MSFYTFFIFINFHFGNWARQILANVVEFVQIILFKFHQLYVLKQIISEVCLIHWTIRLIILMNILLLLSLVRMTCFTLTHTLVKYPLKKLLTVQLIHVFASITIILRNTLCGGNREEIFFAIDMTQNL